MRSLLTLIAGGPGRVSTSAAALVTCAFLIAGHGHDLLVTVWFAFLWFGAFAVTFAILAIIAASTGIDGDSPRPAQKEADHG